MVVSCALASFLELMVIHSQEEQRRYVYTIFSRLEILGGYFLCNYVKERIRVFMILSLPFQTHGGFTCSVDNINNTSFIESC